MALRLTTHPVYLATARIWDEEFRERVRRHQERRGPEWTNIEEEKLLSRHDLTGRVAVIDCVTLWGTNFFFDLDAEVQQALEAMKEEFDKLSRQDATLIFVTNEIGSGGTSENAVQRKFTDLQGWINQYIASHAQEVYLMVSGIPVPIKS
jgi:adenosylcobinamide kinase/adenosylcobinamide-phosphate guanylyltransferase